MKFLILCMQLIWVQISFGEQFSSRVNLQNTDSVNLQSGSAEMRLSVAYPFEEMSGVCSIDIISDSYNRFHSIEKLLAEVEFLNYLGKDNVKPTLISSTVLRVHLAPSYVDGFTIRT